MEIAAKNLKMMNNKNMGAVVSATTRNTNLQGGLHKEKGKLTGSKQTHQTQSYGTNKNQD